MLHGTVLAVESLWLGKIIKSWKIPFQHFYLLTVVMMAWVLFRVPELTTSLLYFKALAGLNAVDGLNYHLSLYLNMELLVVLLAGIAGAMPLARVSAEYVVKLSTPRLYLLAETAGTVLILVASCVTLSGSTYSAFIYRQF
jgi:alginate O-acetyltransferase complex protein AlgI